MVGVGGVWSAFKSIILLEERVKSLAGASKEQQQKVQQLAGRVIRLEAQVEMLTMAAFAQRPPHAADARPAVQGDPQPVLPRPSTPEAD